MINHLKQTRLALFSTRIFAWLHQEMAPALLRRRIIGAAVIISLLAAVYWLVIASNRYVSETHVVILSTNLTGGHTMDAPGLMGISGSRADQLLLRDYLLSIDMLKKLDAALNLRAHYSDWHRDPLSRMWFRNSSMEWFHRHYLSRVSVEFDDLAGVMVIKAQAYDPKTAQAIATLLVREGEQTMNTIVHRLAQDQVDFMEKQSALMNERAMRTRQAVLDFQNKKGLVSPQATAENMAGIVARLEAQRAELETRRSALQAFLVPDHPSIVQIVQQIEAVVKQIDLEQAKLASPKGKSLNRTVEEFQRLQMLAAFAEDAYKTALVAMEKGRIEATRNIKTVCVIQSPTLPEYSLEPCRFYNTLVFMLVSMLVAGVAHLLAAIVRDHKD